MLVGTQTQRKDDGQGHGAAESNERLRRTEQGLSGCVNALSLRAAALYTVSADRFHSRCIPVRSRLRLQGAGSPRGKIQAELA